MTRNNLTFVRLAALLLASFSIFVQAQADPVFGTNLIANGGAEAGGASPDGFAVVAIPGWTVTQGGPNVVSYATGTGFPVASDPGPASRGNNFFTGGNGSPLSQISQTIDVSGAATLIDAGGVTFTLSGFLGGFSVQDDQALLTATFVGAGGTILDIVGIGPVLSADRGGLTGLLAQSSDGLLPAGTRSVVISLQMTRTSGTYNDGYADNLSFIINETPAAVPEPATMLLLGTGLAGMAARWRRRRAGGRHPSDS